MWPRKHASFLQYSLNLHLNISGSHLHCMYRLKYIVSTRLLKVLVWFGCYLLIFISQLTWINGHSVVQTDFPTRQRKKKRKQLK